MGFSVTVHRVFRAGHSVTMPDGVPEASHDHDWEVRVTVARDGLDSGGFVVDFHALERDLESVLSLLRDRDLNRVLPVNPTAEHLALHIGRALSLPTGVRLRSVEVTEAPGCVARWEP